MASLRIGSSVVPAAALIAAGILEWLIRSAGATMPAGTGFAAYPVLMGVRPSDPGWVEAIEHVELLRRIQLASIAAGMMALALVVVRRRWDS